LGFLDLITALCAAHRVEVNPIVKIRLAIDKKFIQHNCTNTKVQPPQAGGAPFHHSPIHQLVPSSSSMEALMLEQMQVFTPPWSGCS